MANIKKVKNIYGVHYAVVESFTSTTKNLDNKEVVTTEELVVEYKNGSLVQPALFPVTDEGLKQAREVQKLFNKKNKK